MVSAELFNFLLRVECGWHTGHSSARDNDVRQFCTEEIVEGRVVNGCWSSRFLSFLSPADWRPALQEANPPTDGLMHWGGQGGCPGDGQGDAWSFGQTSLLLTAVG